MLYLFFIHPPSLLVTTPACVSSPHVGCHHHHVLMPHTLLCVSSLMCVTTLAACDTRQCGRHHLYVLAPHPWRGVSPPPYAITYSDAHTHATPPMPVLILLPEGQLWKHRHEVWYVYAEICCNLYLFSCTDHTSNACATFVARRATTEAQA